MRYRIFITLKEGDNPAPELVSRLPIEEYYPGSYLSLIRVVAKVEELQGYFNTVFIQEAGRYLYNPLEVQLLVKTVPTGLPVYQPAYQSGSDESMTLRGECWYGDYKTIYQQEWKEEGAV